MMNCASCGGPSFWRSGGLAALLASTLFAGVAHAQTAAIVTDPANLAVNEGASATYTVVLATQPSGNVTVTVASDNTDVTADTSTASGTQTTLTFGTTSWNTARTVTVAAAGDAGSGDETATLTHTASGGGYGSVTRGLFVAVQDDEQTGTDYDTDEDGLIEISSLVQLNAVRWDLNGDGSVSAGDATNYTTAFPTAATGMGCPDGSDTGDAPDDCTGYELAQDLDFDTDGDGDVDGDDPASYTNFGPLGGTYTATFRGNGHTISNLRINASGNAGVFNTVGSGATVSGVGLIAPMVRGSHSVGALVGHNNGTVVGCYTIDGTVHSSGGSSAIAGGLVGQNQNWVRTSYSTTAVTSAGAQAGGLAGTSLVDQRNPPYAYNGRIRNSYAAGRASGNNVSNTGGLTGSVWHSGRQGGAIFNSYWDWGVTSSTGIHGSSSDGKPMAELQAPTGYTGIYSAWDDTDGDAWDFGTDAQYPVLKYAGFDTDIQFDRQPPSFGSQTLPQQTVQQSVAIRSFQVPAASHPGGSVVHSVTGLPPGLEFDADGNGTCGVALTICGTTTGAGTYTVTVQATNARGATTNLRFTVFVAGIQIPGSLALDELSTSSINSRNYAVRLTESPSATTTVAIVSGDPGAVTVNKSTLTFTTTNWSTGQSVTAQAAQDNDPNDESATITHEASGGGYNGISAELTVVVDDKDLADAEVLLDADPATPAALDAGPLLLDEDSARSKSYTVKLSQAPSATMAVAVASDNGAVSVSTSSLTFTTSNWNTARTVTATATRDADQVDEAAELTHIAGGADGYAAVVLRVGVRDAQRAGTDYDTDEDGLIEIASLAQLNAMRWDPDGDGVAKIGNATSYEDAFPGASAGMGCPDGGDTDQTQDTCAGYELTRDLDFDTDGDGSTWSLVASTPTSDSDDTYHNSGGGWHPIGIRTDRFNTTFNGNGHVVRNLFISRNLGDQALFGATGTSARITSVGVAGVRIHGAGNAPAALVGENRGRIVACWASGAVQGAQVLGGLVGAGNASSVVVASYSTASLSITGGSSGSGAGLVGWSSGTIRAGYSTGAVTGGVARGGFALGDGSVTASYWDTTLSGVNDDSDNNPPEGKTTSQLQMPTEYGASGLYAAWDDEDMDDDGVKGASADDAWDFGTASQHPVLKFAGFDTALQFNSQGTDSTPTFGSGTVPNKTFQKDHAIAQFQIPAATGGNGAISYIVAGLPDGLVFDADGSGTCGTARSVCGTPSTNVNVTVTVTAVDNDDNTADRDTLTFTVDVVTPSAAITATNPSTLTEAGLDGATATVTLTSTTFVSGVATSSFMLITTVPSLTIASVATVSAGDTTATLTLGYGGSNFDDQRSLGVTVATAAHALAGDLATATVDVFPTPGVTLSAAALSVPEDDNANYTVRLASAPSGNVTVAITGAGSGISVNLASLTFTASNWNTARTVRVTAVDDPNPTHEVVTLTHTPTGGGYAGVPAATLRVTATDDDAPSLRVSPTSLTIAEGRTATYRVRLNAQPSAAVTVTVGGATAKVTVDADPDATGDQTELAFDATDWNRWRTVRVAGAEDGDGDDEAASLTHTVSGASEYAGLALGARPGVSVSVVDDDEPTVELSRSSLALSEGGGSAAEGSWTARLANLAPTGTVTVAVTSGDPAVALVGAPVALSFTATTWRTWRTVTARAVDDDNATSERVAVRHAATGANYGGAEAELRVVVTDDEAPPGAPAGLSATPGNGRASLAWSDPDNPSITRYEWRFAEEGAELGDWAAVAGAGPGTTSLTAGGLANGRAYVFEVRAGNEVGDGPASRTSARLAADPNAPAGVSDAALTAGLAAAVGKADGAALTRGDLATVLELDLSRPAGAAATPSSHGAGVVRDVSGLELAVNLRRLNLSGNAVTDIGPLARLERLEWVDLRGNPLSSESVRVHAAALRERGVAVLHDAPADALIADPGLRLGVERALDKAPGSELTAGDLLSLRELDASSLGVRSLAGLGGAENLERLWLGGNRIAGLGELSGLDSLRWLDLSDNGLTDVSGLSGLTGLTTLLLGGNRVGDVSKLASLTGLTALSLPGNAVADVSPLAELTALEDLSLTDNRVADLSRLSGLTRLERLRLGGNRVADARALRNMVALARLWLDGNRLGSLAPLSGLSSLRWLDASDNRVEDVSALADMESLARLRLDGNRIADVGPLASGSALGEGDVAGLRGNPLSAESLERHVPALRTRGVAVLAGVALPYFPAASEMSEEGGGREGFARVSNRSAEAGEVLVAAVDAAGTRRGPARLALGAGRTAHFNSRDLEDGNAGKGLWPGVGSPGVAGAWRLELETTLDVEAVAYVRTSDGFVAPASGRLPRAGEPESLRAGVFNPGRNRAQRSVLRVWNPGASAEPFTVWGVDDAGSGRLATGRSAPAGGAVEIGAARLEATRRSGWGLGEGAGKWRLSVNAPWPVAAMSLLESAGSRVSDLSAAPSAGVDGLWRAPLFPAASADSSREGFARVSNRSARAGGVLVTAVDDGGRRAGPVALTLGAGRTVHFNARDLRDGAPEKGLAAGVGEPAQGDWRLEFASGLNLRVSSFARSADGFLTSLVEVVPRNAEGAARVFFLNPGSNRNQRSLLRLVNDGGGAAAVVVTGVDDAGVAGGEVRLTIPAGEARTLTAMALEAGGEGLEGGLGDGAGKWRLTVASDNPVTVMSLLESATGHLANLSAGGER